MKKMLILIFSLYFQNISFAQDIIYKTDGNEIKAKVIEIYESSIKYKNFDQQEGPIRNISQSQVFMIKYQDGKTEKFTTITNLKGGAGNDTTKEIKKMSATEIDLKIAKAKTTKNVGLFLLAPGVVCLFVGGLTYVSNPSISGSFLGTSVPFIISGIIVTSIGQASLNSSKKRKAELGFQVVPFNDLSYRKIVSVQAISFGIRISI